MIATSDSSATIVSSAAKSSPTATAQRGKKSPSAGHATASRRRNSATVARAGRSSLSISHPARSRARAKRRTEIVMGALSSQGLAQALLDLGHQPVSQRQVLNRVQGPLARAFFHLHPTGAALGGAEVNAPLPECVEHRPA